VTDDFFVGLVDASAGALCEIAQRFDCIRADAEHGRTLIRVDDLRFVAFAGQLRERFSTARAPFEGFVLSEQVNRLV
jgi:hypothetical protein